MARKQALNPTKKQVGTTKTDSKKNNAGSRAVDTQPNRKSYNNR